VKRPIPFAGRNRHLNIVRVADTKALFNATNFQRKKCQSTLTDWH